MPYIAPVVKSRVMLECWTEIKGLVGPPFQPPQPQRCDLEVGSKFHESWQCKRCKTRNDGSYNHYDLHGGSSKPQEYPHLARDLPREEWISEGFVLLIPQSLALGWSPCGCDNGVYPQNGNLCGKTMIDQWTSGTLYFQTKASKVVTVGNPPMEEETQESATCQLCFRTPYHSGLSSNLTTPFFEAGTTSRQRMSHLWLYVLVNLNEKNPQIDIKWYKYK